MNKTLKVITAVSVLLNVLMLGVIIGHCTGKTQHGFHSHGYHEEITKELSPASRKLVAEAMQELSNHNHQRFKEVRQARDELFGALTAQNFNPELYDQAVFKLNQAHSTKVANMSSMVKHMAKQMSQDERSKLAQVIRKQHQRVHRGYPHGHH